MRNTPDDNALGFGRGNCPSSAAADPRDSTSPDQATGASRETCYETMGFSPLDTTPTTADVRCGGIIAVVLGALFVWMNLGDLPVNFQADGQITEYLAWCTTPDAFGASLNPQLNAHLYSFYYYGLRRLVHFIPRMDLLRLVFSLEILCICAAVYYFAGVLTRDRWAALMTVAVIVWHGGTSIALGGSGGLGTICGAEQPATALCLLALALSWRRRHILAASAAGLAFNLHGSSALFVSAMVLLAAWADGGWRRPRARVFAAALACLCAASPTVLWILTNPPPVASMPTDQWLRFPRWIYPHHMIVSATPLRGWTTLFAFVVPGVLGLAAQRALLRANLPTLAGWVIAAGALLAVGYVFVEIYPIRPVAQLTLWRGTRYLVLLCLAFGLSYLVRCITGRGPAMLAAGLTLAAYVAPVQPQLAWIGHLGLLGLLAITAARVKRLDRALAVLAMVAVCAIVAYECSFLPNLGPYLRWRWPVAVLGLTAVFIWSFLSRTWYLRIATVAGMVVIGFWLAELDVTRSFPRAYTRRAAALLDLAPTIETACPPGQLVVAPPDMRNPAAWANRGSFLCRQQLTAYAYAPWLADEIARRMQWYLGGSVDDAPADRPILPRLCEGYRARSSSDFRQLHECYDVRLAIVERDQRLAFHTVAGNDLFTVYDLAEPTQ